MLGAPGGGSLDYGSAQALFLGSLEHDVTVYPSLCSGGNFNRLWAAALTAGLQKRHTHFAMLHSDIQPEGKWLDIMIREMDRVQADFLSVVVPIKDSRGITSSGIGNPANPWEPYRRFTVREMQNLPETFCLDDLGRGHWPTLHNNGCWIADLRKPVFYERDNRGVAKIFFEFREEVRFIGENDAVWFGESEDWNFSRRMYEAGVKSYLTRAVHLVHRGSVDWPNHVPWGDNEHDVDTRQNWAEDEELHVAKTCA